MRPAAFLSLLLPALLLLTSRPARADSYSWAGKSGRLEVSVWLSGFNEGAGEGGWDEDSARDFASWAARFTSIVSRGARVILRHEIADDGTVVELRSARSGRRRVAVLAGEFDFARALRVVARWVGKPVPPAGASPPLFTIQVLAARSEARADAYARSLDDRGVEPPDPFFDQACHPCLIPSARVDPGADGYHRVTLGVYDRRDAARRAAAKLRGEGIDAWARPL
jgi:hypothetical protein